jgi:hypothetical protein
VRRVYQDAAKEALVVLWEAADRICGKRLKALVPQLLEAMERHGHLQVDDGVRTQLLAMSASTIDRKLQNVREGARGGRKRRSAKTNRVRRSKLPFPLRGLDTDNDSAFMNDTLWNYCQAHGSLLAAERIARMTRLG